VRTSCFELRQSRAERPFFFVARGAVARGGDDAGYGAGGVPDQREREVDVELRSVLVHRSRGEHAPRIFLPAALDRDAERSPVRRTQPLGNDHIEARPPHLVGAVAEDALRGGVPDLDVALAVAQDDRVRRLRHQRITVRGVIG
jgi:hypothetical protein